MHTERSSTGSRAALLALALWLLLPAAAWGQYENTVPKQLIDPLDGHSFEWTVAGSTNALGGYDSDGCSYSTGLQSRALDVAISPTTLYAARIDKFHRTIPEERKEPLMAALLEIGQDIEDARRLAPYERYQIAAVTSELLGDGPFAVGELYLAGAWTVRDTIVGFLPGVKGASDAWQKLTETLPMVRDVDNERGKTLAAFDMARLCHRGGFVHERDSFLAAIDEFEDAGMGAQGKRDEFFRRVAEEAELLAQARGAFMVGLAEGHGTPEDRAYYRYLIGDISRRLGEFDEATTQIEGVLLDKAASEEVKGLAMDIKAVLAVQKRERSAARTAPEETSP